MNFAYAHRSHAQQRTGRNCQMCTVPGPTARLGHMGAPLRPSRQSLETRLSRAHAAKLCPSDASAALATAAHASGGNSGGSSGLMAPASAVVGTNAPSPIALYAGTVLRPE